MKEAFGPRFKKWGLRVERMELLDMKPKASASPPPPSPTTGCRLT